MGECAWHAHTHASRGECMGEFEREMRRKKCFLLACLLKLN